MEHADHVDLPLPELVNLVLHVSFMGFNCICETLTITWVYLPTLFYICDDPSAISLVIFT